MIKTKGKEFKEKSNYLIMGIHIFFYYTDNTPWELMTSQKFTYI